MASGTTSFHIIGGVLRFVATCSIKVRSNDEYLMKALRDSGRYKDRRDKIANAVARAPKAIKVNASQAVSAMTKPGAGQGASQGKRFDPNLPQPDEKVQIIIQNPSRVGIASVPKGTGFPAPQGVSGVNLTLSDDEVQPVLRSNSEVRTQCWSIKDSR